MKSKLRRSIAFGLSLVLAACLPSLGVATAASPDPEASQVVDAIEAQIEARRESILTSPTEVVITGTSYYVSVDGDDENDGLSEDTPWATPARVDQAALQPGDGVFFRRGDVWRGQMIHSYQPGITYSAYGEGDKPAFYGSPEDGAGAENWSLLDGTNDVWVYRKPMPPLGSMVMNGGEIVATKHWAYWNGTAYTEFGTDDVPVDLTRMNDMTFFGDVDLSAWTANPESTNAAGNLEVYNCRDTGPLYLKCGAGNPGEVFSSIEFCTGWGIAIGGGSTVDNLCIKYVGNQGVQCDGESTQGMTVQNCEIAFMGDDYIVFEADTKQGDGGGEGTGFCGIGSVCRNNYIHDGREGAFTVELGWNGNIFAGQYQMGGLVATGNLLDWNNGGIGIINFLEDGADIAFSDILIEDNIIAHTGYMNDLTNCVQDEVACIHVWFAGDEANVKDVTIRNNTFYLGAKLVNLLNIHDADIAFDGNTYVQGAAQKAITYAPTYDTQTEVIARDEADFAAMVSDALGDKNGTVLCLGAGFAPDELDKARAMGILPANTPDDPDAQITSRDMTALLTRLIARWDANCLPEWEALSAAAAASDAPLLRSDGFIALYEAAHLLGLSEWNTDAWMVFSEINETHDTWEEMKDLNWNLYSNIADTGYDPENPDFALHNNSLLYAFGRWSDATNGLVFDYDAEHRTVHGSDPLTWRMAVEAVVRMTDSVNLENYKDYLVGADLSYLTEAQR